MSSLISRLTKAKARLFGTAPEEIPVPFEIPCDCGHRVSGIRRTTYQIATCSACQSSIYILPVNVYPTNRLVRSDVIDGPVISKVGTVMRDLVLGESQPALDDTTGSPKNRAAQEKESSRTAESDNSGSSQRPASRRRRGGQGAAEEPVSAKAVAVAAEAAMGDQVIRIPRQSFSVRLRRAFTPTRILAVAGVAILISTGMWTVRQRQLDQARKVWRAEMDRVDEALKKKDLSVLSEALPAAVKAAATLGKSDVEVRVAESLLRQTQAVEKMSALELVSVFSGAMESGGKVDSEKALAAAAGLKGQFLIFEAELNKVSGDDLTVRLDFPLIVNEVAVEITATSPLLAGFLQAVPGKPCLFAASIHDCRPPGDADPVWRIALSGETCTLITTELHASLLGFDGKTVPGISETLERQERFIRAWDAGSAGLDVASRVSEQTAGASEQMDNQNRSEENRP